MTDAITEAVKADLDARTKKGIKEYGTGLSGAELSEKEILNHAYEEALDLAQYLKKRILEL